MKNTKNKIIMSLVCVGCIAFTAVSAAIISNKAESDTVPASVSLYDEEPPIIILDAGHGESA